MDAMTINEEIVLEAVLHGNVAKLRALGASHAIPPATGLHYLPVHLAVETGDVEILRFLLEEAAMDPGLQNGQGVTPLHLAAERGHVACAKLLLRNFHVNPNVSDGSNLTPAQVAVTRSPEISQLLFETPDFDFWARDAITQATLLHRAVTCDGNSAIIDRLLAVGLSPNDCDWMGRTPLHEASACGCIETIDRLITAGADIHAPDHGGRQPLHFAAAANQVATGRVLIAAGAAVNSRDLYGDTPLHRAAAYSARDMLQLLLTHGAELHAVNYAGKTPPQNSCPEVAAILEKWQLEQGVGVPDESLFQGSVAHLRGPINL